MPENSSSEEGAIAAQAPNTPLTTPTATSSFLPVSSSGNDANVVHAPSSAPTIPHSASETSTPDSVPLVPQDLSATRDEKREKRAEIERQIREKKVNIEGKERDLSRITFEIGELELEVKHASDALFAVESALKEAQHSIKKDEVAVRDASEGLREKDQLLYRSRVATEKLNREIAALKSEVAAKERERGLKNEERRTMTRKRALAEESLERARHGVRTEKAHLHDQMVELGRLSRLPQTPVNVAQKERTLLEKRAIEQALRKFESDERKFSEEVREADRTLVNISDALAKLEREITARHKEIADKELRRAAEVESTRMLTKQKETSRQRFEAMSFTKETHTAHVAGKQTEYARYASAVEEKHAALDAKRHEKNRIEHAIFELKQDIEQLQHVLFQL